MTVKITKPPGGGTIRAIASKSAAHRLLICAALGDGEVFVTCAERSEDIDATAECLRVLGAEVEYESDGYRVRPITLRARSILSRETGGGRPYSVKLNVGESGSTLRFLLPVCGVLGVDVSIEMFGRLPQRPLGALYDEMVAHGCELGVQGVSPLTCAGQLQSGVYTLPGNVSSQYVSGLLFALPLCEGNSEVRVVGGLESRPYVDMTLDALRLFGVEIEEKREFDVLVFCVKGKQTYCFTTPSLRSTLDAWASSECSERPAPPRRGIERNPSLHATMDAWASSECSERPAPSKENLQETAFCANGGDLKSVVRAEGDWSNAAFWLCAGAIGAGITVEGLDINSRQGDKAVVEILRRFGAEVVVEGDSVTVEPAGEQSSPLQENGLRGIEIDAVDIPDLVPVLCAVAAVAEGETRIYNAERLRIKESDRLKTTAETLRRFGVEVTETEDGLVVKGDHPGTACHHSGGGELGIGRVMPCAVIDRVEVESHGDHRIAMMAAVMSVGFGGEVVINGAQAVNKSYPRFFEDFVKLGGEWDEV